MKLDVITWFVKGVLTMYVCMVLCVLSNYDCEGLSHRFLYPIWDG